MPFMPIPPFTPLIPLFRRPMLTTLIAFLFFIATPPTPRTSLLAGRAYRAAAHTRQAGKLGKRKPQQNGRFWQSAGGHLGDFNRHAKLDLGKDRASLTSPEASSRSAVADFSRARGRGTQVPTQQFDLQLVERIERDGGARPLRPDLAARSARRCRRWCAAPQPGLPTGAPRARPPQTRRMARAGPSTGSRPVRWRSVQRCAWRGFLAEAAMPPRNTVQGRCVWLIPGKRPARFTGGTAGMNPAGAIGVWPESKTCISSVF